MTKIDIFSGFLGAGKTTLIKKLIKEAYAGEKLVLIENEFGDIGIDGGFMQEAGIVVDEINSGCICCSLVGDFGEALGKVMTEYAPDRIIIEPSGVGKLSDVVAAVEKAELENAVINATATVVDATKCRIYMKNFGEFFNNQVESTGCIIFSHTGNISDEKLKTAIKLVTDKNPEATMIITDWELLDGKDILDTIEHTNTLANYIKDMEKELHHHHDHGEECHCHDHEHYHHEHGEECHCHDHEHHHHEHGEECHCHDHEHHHHEHGEECHCHDHEHHHHDHGEECHCHDHDHHHHEHGEECHCHDHDHHHHDHGEECSCGCGGHHHHHHADEVFSNWGVETARKYTAAEVEEILEEIQDEEKYGMILRAKGILPCAEGQSWIHFDYVPGEPDVRSGGAMVMGRLCVIGSKLNEAALKELFKA